MIPNIADQLVLKQVSDRSAFNPTCEKLTPVTKDEPCRHCGKPDWCYRVGELEVCKRGAEPASGWVKTSKADGEGSFYFAIDTPKKSIRPKSKNEYVYNNREGLPLVKVGRSDDGEGHRRFYQKYWDGSNWVNGKDVKPDAKQEIKKQIPIYRYQEVRKAIDSGNAKVFVVEGEGVADILWELGVIATTFIGGSGKYRAYGNYQKDLEGAEIIVLCPDRDEPGLKHMEEVAKDFPNAKWLYAPPSDFYWSHLPKSDGLDVKDWIQDGATVEQILEAIEDRRVVVDSLESAVQGEDGVSTVARSENKRLQNLITTQWGDNLKFNEMRIQPELDGQPLELDELSMRLADEWDIDVGDEKSSKAVVYVSKKNRYHPVRDYLESVVNKYPDTEDNRALLYSVATRYLGTSEPLHNQFVAKTMIGAVKRVMEPGCKHDTVLVFQGGQGKLKSTFFETLAISKDWFDDSISSSNSSDKDERLKLRRFWMLELAEVESVFKRKEVAELRGFITTKVDNIRVPYGRSIEPFPRTSIFVASVNPDEFLCDPEGHRRFWVVPVLVDRIPAEQLEKERDLLWASAVHAYRRGEMNYLTPEMEKRNAFLNKRYEVTDSWREVIEFYLESRRETTISTLLSDCLNIEIGRHDKQSQMRVSQILKQLSWTKDIKKTKVNGTSVFVWRCPEVCSEVATENRGGGNRKTGGGNQVATKVATDSNLDTVSVSKNWLPPLDEKNENFPLKKDNVAHTTESYPSESLESGGNPYYAETPETNVQQELESVATFEFDPEANAELMVSYLEYENGADQMRELFEGWTETQRREVKSILHKQGKLSAVKKLLRSTAVGPNSDTPKNNESAPKSDYESSEPSNKSSEPISVKTPNQPTQAIEATNKPSEPISVKTLEVPVPMSNTEKTEEGFVVGTRVTLKAYKNAHVGTVTQNAPEHGVVRVRWDYGREAVTSINDLKLATEKTVEPSVEPVNNTTPDLFGGATP